jgi:hypothetical protein
MDGSWDIVAGGMFDDLSKSRRATADATQLRNPPRWRVFFGMHPREGVREIASCSIFRT